MTTGKQQAAEPSSSTDDLIAELSKLMAQDAHGSRQDAASPQDVDSPIDATKRPIADPKPNAETNPAPFAIRIPGADTLGSTGHAETPAPRFDFGNLSKPAAPPMREAPVFETERSAAGSSAPADLNEPAMAPVVSPSAAEPPPMDALNNVHEHDSIADLIAAELQGNGTVAEGQQMAPVPSSPQPALDEAEMGVAAADEATPDDEIPQFAMGMPRGGGEALAGHAASRSPDLTPTGAQKAHVQEGSDGDNFRVPPVFGLGTNAPAVPPGAPIASTPEPVADAKPHVEHGYLQKAPRKPAASPPASDVRTDLDPIHEIENLIGRAVRVAVDNDDESPSQSERPIASPALRSLATPTSSFPKPPANPPTNTEVVTGVDEAIMAAAAATGAEIGWVNEHDAPQGVTADEPHQDRQRAPRRSGMMRVLVGPGVAIVLLLAAGFGLYSVLGLGRADGPPPVLVADTTPIKSVPEAKSPDEQGQQSIVFNEMNGVVPGAEEQLVSRDQTNVNEVTAIAPSEAFTTEGLVNRKVRTVTVRPDGTIVSGGDDSVAGATILPVDRPNVPVIPGATIPGDSLLASAGAVEPTPAVAIAVPPLVPGTEIAVIDATGAPVPGKTAPVPYIRPASVGDAPARGPLEVNADAFAQTAEPVAPVAAAQRPDVTANSTEAPAYAQLSSQRSPEVAQQIANDLTARYASLLNGARLEVTRADLGSRGIYYRVRVPAASRAIATQFCSSVRASGGDCLAM